MRWIVDAQLPPALSRFLCDQDEEAEHVSDVGLMQATDSEIWDYAIANNSVIVTKDEDFPVRASLAEAPPSIVWLRIGNCSRGELLNWFAPFLDDIKNRISNGDQLIEIR